MNNNIPNLEERVVDVLLSLAAPVDEAGAMDRTRHSKFLESVITGGVGESACKIMCGAAQFASDGIFDECEYFKLVSMGNEIIKRIRASIDRAGHFVMQGEEIDRKDGKVALCYYFGAYKCNKKTFEDCEMCHRGAARFVPEDFHEAVCALPPPQNVYIDKNKQ